jgi:rhamnogalacturonan acetylesterase
MNATKWKSIMAACASVAFSGTGSAGAQVTNIPTPSSASVSARPILFVVGDSTASNGTNLGWGSHLGAYFDPAKITILNRARGGRSSRTFQLEGLWDKVLGEIKPGDYVLIQFGHNDGGSPTVPPGRGSLKGLGEETQVITNNLSQVETVHTFGWYMRKYVADTRARGATPIILSLTVRNEWPGGKVERGPGQYSNWSREVAKAEGVQFVDLNNIVGALYEKLGREKVKEFFPIDHTHTSAEGAELNAKCVVSGLKALTGCALGDYFSNEGKAVETYAPDPGR